MFKTESQPPWFIQEGMQAWRTEMALLETVREFPELDFICQARGFYRRFSRAGVEVGATGGGRHTDGRGDRSVGKGSQCLAVIMEDGDELCEEEKKEIISHYISLSRRRILHGDAHPRNWIKVVDPILLTHPGPPRRLGRHPYRIKLIDWGSSRLVPPGDEWGDCMLRAQVDEIKDAFEHNDVYRLSAPQEV
ncbi:hypothetical protein TREMEDRAFT_66499 [Tremella mesenterica DSM 1558]|uniref:uncharacterized protein n=1 Tax=Tremella mesenterica (strain ATCC 24925 / CBS 8224 / DSM 1558 / NBRC 9311 / NRRL Y-6157 / RJB 2259-6 / UBC 559-6) TaxID=578456 RepID=UPI00032C763E|nr:uncharacterized protein TREMEDRAFT_66499 [Tremella mesenterica DSM 1558]EIW65508.1 hypothetical protein TREMEDRAFT_66499 [Tremella mesenterica DSM 1558]